MFMNQTIDSVVNGAVAIFLSNGYSKRTIQSHVCTFNTIIKLHDKNGVTEYDSEIIAQFENDTKFKYQEGSIGRIRYMHLLKCTDYLQQYHDNGEIDLLTRKNPSGLSIYYEDILSQIQTYPDWNDKTKSSVRGLAMPYLKWLSSQGIDSFDSFDESNVRAYLIDCSSRLCLGSVDTIKRGLKKFHRLLFINGITTDSFEKSLTFTTPPEYKIKKPANLDELAMILSAIDRTTRVGKRDYAIIILAIVTGLRSVDITELSFQEIDWISGEIRITQSKTGNQLALPLTTDVGEALKDYILNGRPNVNQPYIFLREKSPYLKLGRSIPYMVYNKYRTSLGLDKQPFHSLRRAVGTNLVTSGIPLTTVSQILGHTNIDSTKQYISLDSLNLKQCALSLKSVGLKEAIVDE